MFAPEMKIEKFEVMDVITASGDPIVPPCTQDWSGECPTD